MVRVKKNVTILINSAPLFVPHFYDLCGKCLDTELRHFFPNVPQFFPNAALHFHGRRHCNPAKGTAALYKTAHCSATIKVRHLFHQIAELFAGESGTIFVIFSSAAHAAFVAFFLTRTVYRG